MEPDRKQVQQIETDDLKKLQAVEIEILNEIKRICEKHSLRYCLIGGTLLGAVRHQGFIPWDDDLDIVMPRSDYERFCDICSTDLNQGYYLHSIKTDKKYWLSFAKIRKKDTIFDEQNIAHLDVPKGIYVDIFPLDYSKGENSKGQAFRTFFIKQIGRGIIAKKGIGEKNSRKFKVRRFLFKPFSIEFLFKLQTYLMKRVKNGSCYVNFGSNYNTKKQTMPVEFYEPYTFLAFGNGEYPVPQKYSEVLTRIYGDDYMELPPEEKRITHKPVRLYFGDEIESGDANNE